MEHIRLFESFNEKDTTEEKKFVIDWKNYRLQVFTQNTLVAESGFTIEQPDEFFKEKYATIYGLKTFRQFRKKGYAKYMLESFFAYMKSKLSINIVTLIVFKSNVKALNLYRNLGFETYTDYDDNNDSNNSYFTLIKKLN